MLFSSTVFLFVFLPFVVSIYFLLDRKFRNPFLLISSLLFYAWGEPKFVFIMIGSIILNYFFALLISLCNKKCRVKKLILFVMVICNISLFFVFKYMGFTVRNINAITGLNILIPEIALPIGISFFTFQGMSYVIDVYRGSKVQKNPLNVGLYIALFPQLIAGPIVRYDTIADQIDNRTETWEKFTIGTERFVIGLGKKVLFSNALAIVADRGFNNLYKDDTTVILLWFSAIAYMLQIYFDFSGYSDMAIGLGKIFGFEFDENFNYPYMAKSIKDFWRRWHISLSTWFRDYVYIPLGGSRVGFGRNILNLFIVWTLTGVWHGASWNFIFWGWFYFILLVIEKITQIPDRLRQWYLKTGYRILTLLLVLIGWVLFRAENLSAAVVFLKKMFGLSGCLFIDSKSVYIIKSNIVLMSAAVVGCISWNGIAAKVEKKHIVPFFKYIFLLGVLLLSLASLVTSSYNPFIYFNF